MTNDAIIEALKPFLDQVLERENSSINEVAISLMRKEDGYVVGASAWCKRHRFKADTLEDVVKQINEYDPYKQARLEKLEKINQLKAELEKTENEVA